MNNLHLMTVPCLCEVLQRNEERAARNIDPVEKGIRSATRRAKLAWESGKYSAQALASFTSIPRGVIILPEKDASILAPDVTRQVLFQGRFIRTVRTKKFPLLFALWGYGEIVCVPAQFCELVAS